MPPLMLLCHSHCTLDLNPIELKIDREHLLSMTNVWMKVDKAGLNQTLVIDRTDRQTGVMQYTPSSSKGGIKRGVSKMNFSFDKKSKS